ncbi:glycosyltransferase [Chroococcidiopsidales cyanobacterium LEGE 13417]|nr:glycosyltransferase [Chroococcidiopsidales cyanobacterium LEGE 13417]
MRKLYFLVPGTGGKFACGGLWAELKTLNLAKQICDAEAVTYRQREKDTPFLPDLLQSDLNPDEIVFVLSWGFDVAKLANQLKQYHAIYHAHSTNYRFRLSANIPIITVSRHTMGYWGQRSPHSLIYYLPNQISDEFHNFNRQRDIDVLVQARKSSQYLIQELIPALEQSCRVVVVNSYVEDLAELFNRAKVYLYDSAEYWAQQGVTEGFGLQPLEAMACGCQVFSSVNGGLSDYLDPGFNCYKIAGYAREFDVQRILEVINRPQLPFLSEAILTDYRTENILKRLQVILQDVNIFFDKRSSYAHPIPDLTPMIIAQLNFKRFMSKLSKKYLKAR